MPESPLQEVFLRELALTFQATIDRIRRKLADGQDADPVVADELEGLCHGVLVIFDGGTPLADEGLIHIVDEQGRRFARNLHEISPRFRPDESS